jgi:hypothetical protein
MVASICAVNARVGRTTAVVGRRRVVNDARAISRAMLVLGVGQTPDTPQASWIRVSMK